MKLTPRAFEGIYRICDPVKRKTLFRGLQAADPMGAVYVVEVPTGQDSYGLLSMPIKLVAVNNGGWDIP